MQLDEAADVIEIYHDGSAVIQAPYTPFVSSLLLISIKWCHAIS